MGIQLVAVGIKLVVLVRLFVEDVYVVALMSMLVEDVTCPTLLVVAANKLALNFK